MDASESKTSMVGAVRFGVDLGLNDAAKKHVKEVLRIEPQSNATKFMISHTLHDPDRDTKFVDLLHEAGL